MSKRYEIATDDLRGTHGELKLDLTEGDTVQFGDQTFQAGRTGRVHVAWSDGTKSGLTFQAVSLGDE